MNSMTFFFVFVAILALIFLAVNFLLAPHNPYREKYSIFECGFHSYMHQNRTPFDIHFFKVGILFTLFDGDLLLVFPYSQSQVINGFYGLIVLLLFIAIVSTGFVFEIGKNALKIPSRQINTLLNHKSINFSVGRHLLFNNTTIKKYTTRLLVFFPSLKSVGGAACRP